MSSWYISDPLTVATSAIRLASISNPWARPVIDYPESSSGSAYKTMQTMQTANLHMTMTSTPSPVANEDPVRASVTHLLSRACNLPCTAAAQAFSQLVQPTERFQLALDALLPILTGGMELPQRILVCYIIYSMYATYPIAINPFKSAFVEVFRHERDRALQESDHGGIADTEQLVWSIWKILKGDGNDLGPYSPITLARSPLPPKLRSSQLSLSDDSTPETPSSEYRSESVSSRLSEKSSFTRRNSVLDGLSTPSSHSSRRPSPDEDAMIDRLAHGMQLLLAARSRVLSLSEQRIVAAVLKHIPSAPIITANDLPALIAHNPPLGHPLLVSMLRLPLTSQSNMLTIQGSLDVLRHLPPLLPSFDILGRLLQDPTTVRDITTNGMTTIADLVRVEVLGSFVMNVIRWVERTEAEEREGLISDDRVAKGIQNLCRFYNSLIKLSIVDPAYDADSAEMAHFALSHSRYEEANALYRVLVSGRF